MKKILMLVLLLSLTGCAGILKPYANFANAQDPCQKYGKSANWQQPNWCGGSGYSNTVVVNRVGPGAYQVYTTR